MFFFNNVKANLMTKKSNKIFKNWTRILVGAIAVLTVKSIFENDDSEIISNKGRKILSDPKKMKFIYDKIKKSENNSSDIYI